MTFEGNVCAVCRCPTNGDGAGVLVGYVDGRVWEAVRCPVCDEHGRASLYDRVDTLPTPAQRSNGVAWKPLRESPAAKMKLARDVVGAKAWVTKAIEMGGRYG